MWWSSNSAIRLCCTRCCRQLPVATNLPRRTSTSNPVPMLGTPHYAQGAELPSPPPPTPGPGTSTMLGVSPIPQSVVRGARATPIAQGAAAQTGRGVVDSRHRAAGPCLWLLQVLVAAGCGRTRRRLVGWHLQPLATARCAGSGISGSTACPSFAGGSRISCKRRAGM
jgi:hypothetical protein